MDPYTKYSYSASLLICFFVDPYTKYSYSASLLICFFVYSDIGLVPYIGTPKAMEF